jgi:hypothetical protein
MIRLVTGIFTGDTSRPFIGDLDRIRDYVGIIGELFTCIDKLLRNGWACYCTY